MITDNLKNVRQRITRACGRAGRRPDDAGLVCVTKEASVGQMEEALQSGVRIVGENRVQDAIIKHKAIGERVEWHLIGHLQTNKVKEAVKIFSLIHSVDSARLAVEIDKAARKIGKIQDVLVEVNTSGEGSKFGVAPGALKPLFDEIGSLRNVKVNGLMTMAPEVPDPEFARPFFRRLRELCGGLNALRTTQNALRTLSMGMSNDFEVAIEEGATLVRIGRAVFQYDR